jgi:hypothetical protein
MFWFCYNVWVLCVVVMEVPYLTERQSSSEKLVTCEVACLEDSLVANLKHAGSLRVY